MKIKRWWKSRSGMELVQAALLILIAVAIGILFKTQITSFVTDVFSKLDASSF